MYFPIIHITTFWSFETLDCTSVLCLEAILNIRIAYKKHKNVKTMALSRPWKGHLFRIRELKQGDRVSHSFILAGVVLVGQPKFITSVCLHVPTNTVSINSGITNEFEQVSKVVKQKKKSANYEDWLYMFVTDTYENILLMKNSSFHLGCPGD